ncbi:LacI family transcriptional regulator [Rhizobium sp. SGZ-381]|uniref:LacI family transcriptional regulator n=1 Tax=Rhizobium sp. SGZ-381 TaxID=3342800 RepID=UPI00366EA505
MTLEETGWPKRLPGARAAARGSGSEKPTLRTIAELTGLAVTTVSRALAGAPQIALETRLRVARVAQDIGYQPDSAAQRLRTGRTHVISLILDPHEEILGYATSMIGGLSKALRDTPYHLVITPHFSDRPQVEPVRHIIRNRTADGVIFTRTEPQDERVKLLLENDFPFICHGRTELATPHPYVDYDNHAFAYRASRRLIENGCRKLAIILPPSQFTFSRHMQDGFMAAVGEAGIAYEIPGDITIDSRSAAIRDCFFEAFGKRDRPDGVICGGEVIAMAVMAAAHDRSLTLGSDVHVVTKQTSGLFDQVRPRIPTIREDLLEAGVQLGTLLMERILRQTPVADLQHLQTVENF